MKLGPRPFCFVRQRAGFEGEPSWKEILIPLAGPSVVGPGMETVLTLQVVVTLKSAAPHESKMWAGFEARSTRTSTNECR